MTADTLENGARFLGALQMLRQLGATRLEHPGGNLFEHLVRVAELLGYWRAEDDLRLAGVSHAFYGTDGFQISLLELDQRPRLAQVIGDRAEAWVYLYASCDRGAVYPGLSGSGPVPFRDRFTGESFVLAEADARAFVELTAANELDLAIVNDDFARRFGADLLALFGSARDRLSGPAWEDCWRVLAGPNLR